jgi:hypothetical protein
MPFFQPAGSFEEISSHFFGTPTPQSIRRAIKSGSSLTSIRFKVPYNSFGKAYSISPFTIAEVRQAAFLKSLSLDNCELNDDSAEAISDLEILNELSIVKCSGLTAAGLAALTKLTSLKSLRVWEFVFWFLTLLLATSTFKYWNFSLSVMLSCANCSVDDVTDAGIMPLLQVMTTRCERLALLPHHEQTFEVSLSSIPPESTGQLSHYEGPYCASIVSSSCSTTLERLDIHAIDPSFDIVQAKAEIYRMTNLKILTLDISRLLIVPPVDVRTVSLRFWVEARSESLCFLVSLAVVEWDIYVE